MPTYEYLCENCNHQFEAFQSITAEPLKNCPECNGTVKRLIGAGNGLIFKGSGFYITDGKSKAAVEALRDEAKKAAIQNAQQLEFER